jgi:surface antigen
MNRFRAVAAVSGLALLLAGCTMSSSGEVDTRVVTGTSAAAAYASEPYNIGLIGGAIGEELDAGDRRTAMDAEFRALEYGNAGSPVQWRGRNGRIHGDVVAGARYQVNDFACRELTHTFYIDGQAQVAHGTACRQTDGTWKSVG